MSGSASRAGSIRTGIGRSPCTRRQTSSPSIPGSMRSRTTRSGRTRRQSSTPAGPSWATSTAKPSARRRAATAAAITCSSSTMQITGAPIGASVPGSNASGMRVPCRFGAECQAMQLRLIRHATLIVGVAGRRALVDPMLDPAGARPAVQNTLPERRNPLTELPEPPEVVMSRIDGLLVTHLHVDHLDDTAVDLAPKPAPLWCQPEDEGTLRDRGFTDVRPVDTNADWDGVSLARTGGRHGTGEIAEALAPVSGFVLAAPGEPTLYIAGDTVYCDEVATALDEHRPDVVVVNAGGARFVEGDPITMTADDVVPVARHARDATVVAVHMEAINHCLETRADLHQRLRTEGLDLRVVVPEDGAAVPL